jgi:hypothetical protein
LDVTFRQETKTALWGVLIPQLHRQPEDLRYCAVSILGQLRAKEAVGALVGALDDESQRVRTHAMGALYMLVGPQGKSEAWIPDWNAPAEKIAAAVALWKDWWEKEGKARYGQTDTPPGATPAPAIPPAAAPQA